MSRLFHQVVSSATVVGYLLVVIWGPAWHDHQHGTCLSPSAQNQNSAEPSPAEHGSHHHYSRCCETSHESSAAENHPHPPCRSPWHDDDCQVCQTLAHPPLETPAIELSDSSEPVREWVFLSCPVTACFLPAVYDSRGPPRA